MLKENGESSTLTVKGFFCYCHKRLFVVVLSFVLCGFSSGITSRGTTSHRWWHTFFSLFSSALFYTTSAEIITTFYLGIVLYYFCTNHNNILPRHSWNPYRQFRRGCTCLITKTTSSLVWRCGCRYFVDAMTLSTVKTVTKMMKMIGEKKMCAQWMVVAIFLGKIMDKCRIGTMTKT